MCFVAMLIKQNGGIMRNIFTFAITAVVLALVAPPLLKYQTAPKAGPAAGHMMTATTPSDPSNARSVSLTAGAGGHFYTDALIDGRRIDFVVDTGATMIAIRESDAARLGVHPGPGEYRLRMQTANGTIMAAPVDLGRVEIGDLIVRNVSGIVLPDQALAQNLLGMSFLSHVHWQYQGNRLVLEQ